MLGKWKTLWIAAVLLFAISGTALAQWTPTKPGDPRICAHQGGAPAPPAQCGAAAATFAFKAKYARVTGHVFVNTLRCSSTGTLLSYICTWGSPAIQTPVRFTHKQAGWKVAVGVIPA